MTRKSLKDFSEKVSISRLSIDTRDAWPHVYAHHEEAPRPGVIPTVGPDTPGYRAVVIADRQFSMSDNDVVETGLWANAKAASEARRRTIRLIEDGKTCVSPTMRLPDPPSRVEGIRLADHWIDDPAWMTYRDRRILRLILDDNNF